MYSVTSLRTQASSFLSLTGLRVDEFDYLLSYFSTQWSSYHRYYDLKGKRRAIPKFKESKNSSLPTDEDKLFFILCVLKNNALQTFTGFAFGLSQTGPPGGKTSQWTRVLLPLLEKSLQQGQQLPARTQQQLNGSLKNVQDNIFFLDATERPLPRSTDQDNQQDDYSGGHPVGRVTNTPSRITC